MDSGDRSGSGKRQLFSLLCHGSIFLGGLLVTSAIPLVVLLIFDDPVIKTTAKETLTSWRRAEQQSLPFDGRSPDDVIAARRAASRSRVDWRRSNR